MVKTELTGRCQYVETLCKDLGINSRRKRNMITELFQPYKPADFEGFIDEYLARDTSDQMK